MDTPYRILWDLRRYMITKKPWSQGISITYSRRSGTLALAAVGLMVAATTAACGSSSTGSSSTGSSSTGSSSFNAAPAAEISVIGGLDYGPLVGLIGTWKSAPNGGLD